MRKEAKEFRLKKVSGFDHKSHSMKLSYRPLPDKEDEKKEQTHQHNINPQNFGLLNNGTAYFDMHSFLNDCANGDVNLPAPLIEMISNDINKISKQFTEELQKGQLDHHFSSNRSKKQYRNKHGYAQVNNDVPSSKNSSLIVTKNEVEMQSSECAEINQSLPEAHSVNKKQKLKCSNICHHTSPSK